MTTKEIIKDFWGADATSMGWTAIPNSLLLLQGDLRITSTEMCVVMNILMHQWPQQGSELSFPAVESLASRMGVTVRTVQRAISNLEKKGVIERRFTERSDSVTKGKNIYDTSKLKTILNDKHIEAKKKLKGKRKKTQEVKLPFVCTHCLSSKASNIIEFNSTFGFKDTIAGLIPNNICNICMMEIIKSNKR